MMCSDLFVLVAVVARKGWEKGKRTRRSVSFLILALVVTALFPTAGPLPPSYVLRHNNILNSMEGICSIIERAVVGNS